MSTDPLSVVIDDGSGRRDVTRHVSDLSYSETAPGGHSVLSCRINLPLSAFPNLGPNDRVYVLDGNTGKVPFDGYTNNPGKRSDGTGEGFDLTANGGSVLAADRFERLPYINNDLNSWGSVEGVGKSAASSAQVGEFPDDAGTRAGAPCLFLQMPKGSDATAARMRYTAFSESPMQFGAITFFRDEGQSSTAYNVTVRYKDLHGATGTGANLYAEFMSSTGSTESYIITGTHYPQDVVDAWFETGGGFTIGSDNVWCGIGELAVLGRPLDRYGVAYNNPRAGYFLASEIAEDVFGRLMLGAVDATRLEVVASSYHIDSLAFLEPTTAAGVFEALLTLEDYDWGIGESAQGRGHAAWFRPWPTEPRYVLDDRDAIDLPGSDDSQVNRVTVDWQDSRNNPHTLAVGADVRALGNRNPVLSDGTIDPAFVGRIKDADRISLPDRHGSRANAIQAGTTALAEKNRLTYSGSATVTRPLHDLLTGDRVMPHALRAGTVARLAPQGVDVRITERAYSHNDHAATLTLNTPVPSLEKLLARLSARDKR